MQYQPVSIDGRPYAVRLPTGGTFRGENSEWDRMLDVLGEKNPIYHAKSIHSWCQDTDRHDPNCRVYRSQLSPRHWNSTYSYRSEYAHIGYRPVLAPLDPVTFAPAPDALKDIPDGTLLTMGSFYLGGNAQPLPTDPDWCGNIPQYVNGLTIALGDSSPDSCKQLRFIKCGGLLWCDRNLLTGVSWDTLASFGLVFGQGIDAKAIANDRQPMQKAPSLDCILSHAAGQKNASVSPKHLSHTAKTLTPH